MPLTPVEAFPVDTVKRTHGSLKSWFRYLRTFLKDTLMQNLKVYYMLCSIQQQYPEKQVVQGIIKKLEIENKEISDPNEINNEINRFFKNLFAKTLQKFENIILPVLTQEQKQECKKKIFEKWSDRCA